MHAVVGVLSDDADPMVTVMKLEKAPQESYADIGGLDQQIQEIKVLCREFCTPVLRFISKRFYQMSTLDFQAKI